MQVSHDTFAAHSEPAIAENPFNHQNVIAGSKMFSDPAHYQFKIGTYYTTNGGRTWHDTGVLPGYDQYSTTSDISIAYSSKGIAYACLLAVGGKTSGIFISRSTTGGRTWDKPVSVFTDTSGKTFSDKPWIAVEPTTGSKVGAIYVVWNLDNAGTKDAEAGSNSVFMRQQSEPMTEGLVVSRSIDGGQTFARPHTIRGFDSEFSIGAIPAVSPDGSVNIVYATISDKTGLVDHFELVQSHDRGITYSNPLIIVPRVNGLPNHLSSGTFRNLSLPTFAVSPSNGSMVIAWADQGSTDTDILTSRSTNGGMSWTPPARVNHDRLNNGKDQFMPALAVAPNGVFTCSWFDRRRDPLNRLIDVDIAQSTDDGATFGHNLQVTRHSWDPAIGAPQPEGKANNTFIGDYQALAVDNRTVHPLWNDTQNGKTQQIRTAVMPVRLFLRK